MERGLHQRPPAARRAQASAATQGSYGTIRDYVLPFREAGAAPPAVPGPPKARDLASWILTDPDNLDDDEKEKLAQARERCPHLDALAGHVTEFAKILTGLHGDRLDDWITAVEADDQPDLHSFARGLKRDHDAVLNGLTMPWSSGVVEGNVNRLKMIKRQMYGRATFGLLRKRVLLCQRPCRNGAETITKYGSDPAVTVRTTPSRSHVGTGLAPGVRAGRAYRLRCRAHCSSL